MASDLEKVCQDLLAAFKDAPALIGELQSQSRNLDLISAEVQQLARASEQDAPSGMLMSLHEAVRGCKEIASHMQRAEDAAKTFVDRAVGGAYASPDSGAGTSGQQTQAGVDPLSPDEANLIHSYTCESGDETSYRTINNALRYDEAMTPTQSDYAANLDAALEKLPAHEGIVYRGTSLSREQIAQYRVGEVKDEPAFTSATKNADKQFAGNTEFVIVSTSGRRVDKYSALPSEEEVLFRHNTKFKVLRNEVDERTGKHKIILREV